MNALTATVSGTMEASASATHAATRWRVGDCAGYVSDAIRGHSFRCDPRRHRLVYRDYIADRQADGQYPMLVTSYAYYLLMSCWDASKRPVFSL
jgi:hypothetical protein